MIVLLLVPLVAALMVSHEAWGWLAVAAAVAVVDLRFHGVSSDAALGGGVSFDPGTARCVRPDGAVLWLTA
jgi:hypothetical protein